MKNFSFAITLAFAFGLISKPVSAQSRDFEPIDVHAPENQITSIIYSSAAGLALVGVTQQTPVRPLATMVECEAPVGELTKKITQGDLRNCRAYRGAWFEATEANFNALSETFKMTLSSRYDADHRGDPGTGIFMMMIFGGGSTAATIVGVGKVAEASRVIGISPKARVLRYLKGGSIGLAGMAGMALLGYGGYRMATDPQPNRSIESQILLNYKKAVAAHGTGKPVIVEPSRYDWVSFYNMVKQAYFDSLSSLARAQ